MVSKILLGSIDQVLHIMINRNSIAEGFRIILWLSMPTDMWSKVYVGWAICYTCFLICIELLYIANVLHHPFRSMAIQHEVFHMNEGVLIIISTYRKSSILHCYKIWCINSQSHTKISISSIRSEYQVSQQSPECWFPCRTLSCLSYDAHTDPAPFRPYKALIMTTNFTLWTTNYQPDRNHALSFGFEFRYTFWIVCVLQTKAIKGGHHQYYPNTIPW